MRLQVLLPLMLFGLLTVIAIIIPASEGIAVNRTQQLTLQRATSMDQIVQRAETAVASDDAAGLIRYLDRFADVYGESAMVVDSEGALVASTGDVDLDARAASLVLAASRTVPQRSIPTIYPWSDDTHLVAEPFANGSSAASGAVLLEVNQAEAKAEITGWWALVALAGVLLLLLLFAASQFWTSWVLRPVRALDAAANALAEQREPDLAAATGPLELRRLSSSFARMSRGVEDALEQQRGFVAEASHQLRNPLAAIRLRIDALPRDDADEAELEAVGGDLDRLEHVVDRMLVLANAEHRATAEASGRRTGFADGAAREHVTSAAMLAAPHEERFRDEGMRLRVVDEREVRVVCRKSDLEEIVETLLDNARKYAGGGATVTMGFVLEGPEHGGEAVQTSGSVQAKLHVHGQGLAGGPGSRPPAERGGFSGATGDGASDAQDGLEGFDGHEGFDGFEGFDEFEGAAGHALLEISDDGPGVRDDELAQLGTRFWRSPDHRAKPGTGLGLAIVGELARANRASVSYDRAPEGGLRARVRLVRTW
ncbi:MULTISPECIES: sensor histidine kinase [unclassified Pseudoclavibacter]|uniref:sensor histidine kinase n=1 Tax=unclassified Pseudoclavibacter TaxID=2615177 RepID=UPI001BA544A4|nr:HAMP domain-containing sensor histidine kinase [Pseudoclavibacter sp. Marseille-Q4354]MBS3179816.1 HAMP domain-containing histidine kinase [Pseudoclavibacter sp. Marseille-Q4354]